MELVAGLLVADRFQLVRQLGTGGMGTVWLAQHTGLDVPCAVKFIHAEAARSAELVGRFEREAKSAAQIRSPFVVQIFDHGVWQDHPYIAMEYLEGEDLRQRLARVRKLAPADTLRIATQIARALSKAHAAGVIHRDLKPANVFLVRDDEQEIAKVLDFGIAKAMEGGLDQDTSTGQILGTPFYMSPEQARGSKSVDHRTDLWALAVLIYRCVVGKLPFQADVLAELMVRVVVDPIPVPSQVSPVPPGFDAWWARAASRDPGARFQSAKELVDALSVALELTGSSGASSGPGTGPLSTSWGTVAAFGKDPAMSGDSSASVPAAPTTLVSPILGQPIPGVPAPFSPSSKIVMGAVAGAVILGIVVGASVSRVSRASRAKTSDAIDPPAVPAANAVPERASQVVPVVPTPSVTPAQPVEPAPVVSAAADLPIVAAPTTTAPSTTATAAAPASKRGAGAVEVGAQIGAPKTTEAKRPPAKGHAGCDPNFFLDADGQKHFKPECF